MEHLESSKSFDEVYRVIFEDQREKRVTGRITARHWTAK